MEMKKRAAAFAAAAMIAVSGAYAPISGGVFTAETAIVASAASVASPQLKEGAQCGDKVIVFVSNASAYADKAKITVYVSGNKVKTIKGSTLKNAGGKLSSNGIYTTNSNGKKYIKPNTKYTVTVEVSYGCEVRSNSIAVKTSAQAYYAVKKGTAYYTLSGGKMKKAGTMDKNMIGMGYAADSKGALVGGKSVSSVKPVCVKLRMPVKAGKNVNNEQIYKYKYVYVKPSSATRKSIENVRNTVVNFGVKMSRTADQKYVSCGEIANSSKTRSDCSGLTKMSYLQAGIYIDHVCENQAHWEGSKVIFNNIKKTGVKQKVVQYKMKNSSTRVDLKKLQKGDLLFFLCNKNNQDPNPVYVPDGIGHTALYIGNGKFVHFTSSYGLTNRPCRVEDLRNYERTQLPVVRVVRLIY